eukprot:12678851-Alexandrium_andersonii.AAC.1
MCIRDRDQRAHKRRSRHGQQVTVISVSRGAGLRALVPPDYPNSARVFGRKVRGERGGKDARIVDEPGDSQGRHDRERNRGANGRRREDGLPNRAY